MSSSSPSGGKEGLSSQVGQTKRRHQIRFEIPLKKELSICAAARINSIHHTSSLAYSIAPSHIPLTACSAPSSTP